MDSTWADTVSDISLKDKQDKIEKEMIKLDQIEKLYPKLAEWIREEFGNVNEINLKSLINEVGLTKT